MILKGRKIDWAPAAAAAHFGNEDDNEKVTIVDVRGTLADDLLGAFQEMKDAIIGTRAEKHMYSLKVSPEIGAPLPADWLLRALDVCREELGIPEACPTVCVEHVKDGRTHGHILVGMVNPDTMRVWDNTDDYKAHDRIARRLEVEFGHRVLDSPDFTKNSRDREPGLWEMQQGNRLEIDPRDVRAQLRELKLQCDSGQAFAAALTQAGYGLALGDKARLLAIDPHGGIHNLSRTLGEKVEAVRGYLGDQLIASLPSAEQAIADRPNPIQPKRAIDPDVGAVFASAWQQSQGDGARFAEGLAQSGYTVALAKFGRFVGVDAEGACHSISKASLGSDHAAAQAALRNLYPKDAPAPSVPDVRKGLEKTRNENRRHARKVALAAQAAKPLPEAVAAAWRAADGDGLRFAVQLGMEGYSLAVTKAGKTAAVAPDGGIEVLDRAMLRAAARGAQVALDGAFGQGQGLTLPTVAEVLARQREDARAASQAEKRAAKVAGQRERLAGNGLVNDINAAWRQLQAGKADDLATALGAQGIVLARVSGQEAEDSRRARITAQLTDPEFFKAQLDGSKLPLARLPRELQEGDFYAVTMKGAAFKLDEGLIRDDARAIQRVLSKIPEDALPSLAAARFGQAERIDKNRQVREAAQAERPDRLADNATAIAMRQAWQDWQDGRKGAADLASAMQKHDLVLARVTDPDAVESRRVQILAQIAGDRPPGTYSEGALVAVNRFGSVYRLDANTLRQSGRDIGDAVLDLEHTSLPSVAGAVTLQAERQAEKREAWFEQHRQERAAQLGEHDDVKAMRQAWARADNGSAFVTSLQQQGFAVARVTEHEAFMSRYTAEVNKTYSPDYQTPTYEAGELVAFNQKGWGFRLDAATLDDKNTEQRLAGVTLDLPALTETREAIRTDRAMERSEVEPWQPPLVSQALSFGDHAAANAERTVHLAGAAATVFERAFTGLVEMIFGGVGHAQPQLPAIEFPRAPSQAVQVRETGKRADKSGRARDDAYAMYLESHGAQLEPEIINTARRLREDAKREERERDKDRER